MDEEAVHDLTETISFRDAEISHLNEEKNSLEVFLLFQFRLPPLEKSGADIKVELAAIRFSY